MLVDCGGGGDWDQGRLSIAPFLWSKGITRIDGIVITHPHFDHFGGLGYLLDEFEVGALFDCGDLHIPFYDSVFKDRSIRRTPLYEGAQIKGAENVELLVLHPPRGWIEPRTASLNDSSVVFRIGYGSKSILMTGDAERIALTELNRYGTFLKCDVLKSAHRQQQ